MYRPLFARRSLASTIPRMMLVKQTALIWRLVATTKNHNHDASLLPTARLFSQQQHQEQDGGGGGSVQAERSSAIQRQLAAMKQETFTNHYYHLAQFNLAKLKAPLHDPAITEFALALEPINDLAKVSPGFVWLHENDCDDEKNAIPELRADPLIMPNLSLWQDLKALHHFVFKTGHFMYLKRKKEWMTSMQDIGYPHAVYWWRPAQHEPPSLLEAFDKIRTLRDKGNTPDAFDFKSAKDYPAPKAPKNVEPSSAAQQSVV